MGGRFACDRRHCGAVVVYWRKKRNFIFFPQQPLPGRNGYQVGVFTDLDKITRADG